jgi:hypothetical protein
LIALKGVTEKWRRLAGHGNNDDGEDEVVDCCKSDALAVVEMSITHVQALNNPHYLENCYAPSDPLRNKGFLTLVAPAYFDFARSLKKAA